MTNITETPVWSPAVDEIDTTDQVLGGPDGVINIQAKQIADRTAYLKQEVEAAGAVAIDAGGKADNALAQIAAIEQASGSAVEAAADALIYRDAAQAAEAVAVAARNAAEAASAQAGDNAGYAAEAAGTSQLKASEAQASSTAAVSAASSAVAARDAALQAKTDTQTTRDGAVAEIDDAASAGVALVSAEIDSIIATSETKKSEITALADGSMVDITAARDITVAAKDVTVTKAAEAAAGASTATTGAGTATSQAGAATTARIAAEAAMDAAQLSAGVYADTAAGLAATTAGQYFSVPVSSGPDALILYRHEAGPVATEVTRYMSSRTYSADTPLEMAWSILDANNFAAIGLKDDGTFVADEVEILSDASVGGNLSVGGDVTVAGIFSVDEVQTTVVGTDTLSATVSAEIAGAAYADDTYPALTWAIADASGNAALGLKDDGTVVAKQIEAGTLVVGTLLADNIPALFRGGGTYSHSLNYINNAGQSLGMSSTPQVALTTAQEYDNIGFARDVYASLVPLTVANTGVSGMGENPMYGTLGHIKELITEENGISYAVNNYQLAAACTAVSGSSITELIKGTAPYTTAMAQIQSAKNIAASYGRSMSFQATTWTQGETDAIVGMAKATYKGHLKQLVSDYNTDAKAITGQYNNAIFITYQTASVANMDIALAQLEVANENPLVYMACPMYQFEYGDYLHITATSSKWLGGYYGLVYKRVVIDKQDWQPLQPVAHAINGNVIDLIFNKTGLVFDTTQVPAQTNQGFAVVNGAGAAQTISAIAIVAPNRVRITMATTPASGWAIKYAHTSTGFPVFSPAYAGGAGNLRDNQGDTIVYSAISKPMHNWCVIFNYSI
jgi:hypothetical protein